MRIISGKYKGRRFYPPGNLHVRPTTDFAKEGLFNVLNNRIDFEETQVLDLFSGTGMVALEFISRGAGNVVAVDANRRCCKYIRSVIDRLSVNNLQVITANVRAYCKSCKKSFNLVFADPPYDYLFYGQLPGLILKGNLLNKGGMVVIEHPHSVGFETHEHFIERRIYGKVNFTIFSC